MKKILGISLCALFAVSAANADIASKLYVDGKVGAIDTSGIGDNAAAITALQGRVTTSEGKITTLEGKVAQNETNIADNASDITTNADNISANTDSITSLTERVDGHDTSIGANTNAITGITQNIADMTANVTGSHFIQGVSQANGKVTPTGKNFETTLSTTTNDNAPTSKAVADYVAGQVNDLEVGALEGRVDANETNITNLTSRVGTNEAGIGTLNNSMTTLSEKVDMNTNNITTHETKIGEHTEAIQGMDLTGTTGQYVTVVSQTDGKVSATGANFATNVATGGTNAPTSDAVVTYVRDNAVNTVTTGTNNGTIKVDGQEVSVAGLGSAAYTDASTLATTASLKALAYKDTVATTDIEDNAVTMEKIANDAVTSAKIDDETITNADVATNAQIASSKIAFNTTQTTVFGSGINSGLVEKITTNENEVNRLGVILKPSEQCLATDNSDGCTLVVRNGTFSWEAVTRGEGEE